MNSSRTYTVAETSAILGIAQSTIYEMVRDAHEEALDTLQDLEHDEE